MAKNNFYAVAKGHKIGIFTSWSETQIHINKFKGAMYKGFPTKDAAEKWLAFILGEGEEVEDDKIYVVKVGREIGIFKSWKKCKDSIDKYPNALYKSFPKTEKGQEDAERYLTKIKISTTYDKDAKQILGLSPAEVEVLSEELSKEADHIVCYVDGSFLTIEKKGVNQNIYSAGVLFLENGVVIDTLSDLGDNAKVAEKMNVAGELMASMRAIDYVVKNKPNCKKVTIVHDYLGIANWPLGNWPDNDEIAKMYINYLNKRIDMLDIRFIHCKGHSKNKYNEQVDGLAYDLIMEYKNSKSTNIKEFNLKR